MHPFHQEDFYGQAVQENVVQKEGLLAACCSCALLWGFCVGWWPLMAHMFSVQVMVTSALLGLALVWFVPRRFHVKKPQKSVLYFSHLSHRILV